MSLSSLTFGVGREPSAAGPRMFVQKPLSDLKIDPTEQNRIEIIKTAEFFGHENVYVIARVVSGVMLQNKCIQLGEKLYKIEEIESKLGKTNAKKGMTVSFFVPVEYKEELKKGTLIECSLS